MLDNSFIFPIEAKQNSYKDYNFIIFFHNFLDESFPCLRNIKNNWVLDKFTLSID